MFRLFNSVTVVLMSYHDSWMPYCPQVISPVSDVVFKLTQHFVIRENFTVIKCGLFCIAQFCKDSTLTMAAQHVEMITRTYETPWETSGTYRCLPSEKHLYLAVKASSVLECLLPNCGLRLLKKATSPSRWGMTCGDGPSSFCMR